MKLPTASFCAASACAAAPLIFGGYAAVAQTPSSGAGIPSAFPPPPAAAAAPILPPAALDVPDNYRLNVDDTISIEVVRHGDVSRAVRVPADGRVRLLRLDSPVLVQGKTCAEVADELTRRLQTEGKLRLRPGQVAVFVVGMRTRRVYIRGNMITNRQVDLKNGWRITELITELGGIPQPDRILSAKILNSDTKLRPEPVTLDLIQILDHPDSPQNVALIEGDTLVLQGPQAKRLIIKGVGPTGVKDLDERFTLRQSLDNIGFSPTGAGGDLKNAKLWHYTKPGDPTSPQTSEAVNLYKLLSDKNSPDYTFNDLDTLEIPVSLRYVSLQGATAGPAKYLLPEDRKTYLADVMQWGSYGNAKIGEVHVRHYASDGVTMLDDKKYDFGKYKTNGDQKENPEISDGDMVFVPTVKRTDPNAIAGGIFTSWSLYSIFKALVPGH